MYVWTGPWSGVRNPTPLLSHLAGDFAGQIAILWPAPHTDFLAALPARRQLVYLLLSRTDGIPEGLEDAIGAPLKRAIRRLLPGAPAGLTRALGKLGELAWSAADYGRLLAVLGDAARAKALWHAEAIEPGVLQRLAEAPDALVSSGAASLKLSRDQLELLAEAHAAIARRQGVRIADEAASGWGRTKDLKALFDKVREDLICEFPEHPFPGAQHLKPLRTKADMRRAAAKFRNCLRSDRMDYASTGEYAFLEWTTGPGAVVQLVQDAAFGWRVDEVKTVGNQKLPERYRPLLIEDLRALGIHVGRSFYRLESLLEDAHRPGFRLPSLDAAIAGAVA